MSEDGEDNVGQGEALARERLALAEILQGRPEVSTFELAEPLRMTGKSWVFKAVVNGQDCVVKRFLGEKAPKIVLRLKVELDTLQGVFTDPRYQANRCLFAWPESGVVVLSHAPGQRLGDQIAAASEQERHDLLVQSGEWLRQYCAPRQREATFGPGFWVKKLAQIPTDRVNVDRDQVLLASLLQHLRKQIQTVKGTPVLQAATHGDFVAMNLHYHDGVLYGLDIQGESWLAISKDAARFLVWLQIHEDNWPSERRYGIGAKDLAAFLETGVVRAQEHPTTLRFFIGEQLYLRFVENYRRRRLRENTRAAIEHYLKSA